MTIIYAPRNGGLAAHVVDFLSRNPDEELDLDAIVAKFDAVRSSIHTQMAKAVEAGLVARLRMPDGSFGYKAGPNLPKPASDITSWPPAAKAPAPTLNPAQVPIDTDVPVPTGRRATVDWTPLLQRLKPNHSAQLPLTARTGLAKAIKAAREAKQGEFTIRVSKDTSTLRVWRLN